MVLRTHQDSSESEVCHHTVEDSKAVRTEADAHSGYPVRVEAIWPLSELEH